jgi:hypothetical protein
MPGVSSLFTTLSTFTGTPFFLCDEMHLIGRGISILCFNLISPQNNEKFKSSSDEYTFDFQDVFRRAKPMEKISDHINMSRINIPTSFQGSWDGLQGFNRAVDWLDYLLYAIPTLVVPRLKHQRSKKAIMDLVNGCAIALQWNITQTDLENMNR